MPIPLAIALAGSLGALARYAVDVLLRPGHVFPWATFVVNISGAFLLGVVVTVLSPRLGHGHWLRPAITIGFLGSYTTFSTFTLESYRLAHDGSLPFAAANGAGSVVAGLAALSLGVVVGRAL